MWFAFFENLSTFQEEIQKEKSAFVQDATLPYQLPAGELSLNTE